MHRQKGFSAVEAIVIVVIVAVVGVAGWLVWHANHKPKTETTVKKTTTTVQKDTSTSNAQSSGATKYLDITQWGVKFALTADTVDAYYDANSNSSFESMSLRVHSLDSEADCKNSPLSIAGIFRVPKDAENVELQNGKMYRETVEGQVVGDKFYFISGSQYYCTENPDLMPLLQGVRNGFVTASGTIQKD